VASAKVRFINALNNNNNNKIIIIIVFVRVKRATLHYYAPVNVSWLTAGVVLSLSAVSVLSAAAAIFFTRPP